MFSLAGALHMKHATGLWTGCHWVPWMVSSRWGDGLHSLVGYQNSFIIMIVGYRNCKCTWTHSVPSRSIPFHWGNSWKASGSRGRLRENPCNPLVAARPSVLQACSHRWILPEPYRRTCRNSGEHPVVRLFLVFLTLMKGPFVTREKKNHGDGQGPHFDAEYIINSNKYSFR